MNLEDDIDADSMLYHRSVLDYKDEVPNGIAKELGTQMSNDGKPTDNDTSEPNQNGWTVVRRRKWRGIESKPMLILRQLETLLKHCRSSLLLWLIAH